MELPSRRARSPRWTALFLSLPALHGVRIYWVNKVKLSPLETSFKSPERTDLQEKAWTLTPAQQWHG